MSKESRKRPVNLTLDVYLVDEVKCLTDNMSGVVESLLTDYVARERKARLMKSNVLELTVKRWNAFNSQAGSFADEYSTL